MSGAAATITDDGVNAEFTSLYDIDGYSRVPLLVGTLPDALVADGFVDILGDFAATESPDSQSIIIDTTNTTFVPHFTDVDPRAFDPLRRAIALHPIVDLAEQRRYIVVLQGVKNESGELAKAAGGFALLRDDKTEGIRIWCFERRPSVSSCNSSHATFKGLSSSMCGPRAPNGSSIELMAVSTRA